MSKGKLLNSYPDGFRARRGLNWFSIGLMYATYYMCRYNFRTATNGIRDELGFDPAFLWAWWSLAYGTGQLVNGLVSDKFGGRKCLLTGAIGTITISMLIGFTPLVENFKTFAILMMCNAYFQSFGAPGFVKINAAWFRRNERGTFAGIFGIMIQLGQIGIFNLAPFILGGMAVFGHQFVDPGQWRLLFVIPPMFTACAALFLFFAVKETPDAAGYEGVIKDELDDSKGVKMPIGLVFRTIFTNPFVWFYAVAYMATGAVRHSSDQLGNLFFSDMLGFDMKEDWPPAARLTLTLIPIAGIVGSIVSGFISDKYYGGKRGPVSFALYVIMTIVLGFSAWLLLAGNISPTASGVFIGCTILILISLSVNATHSLVGAAAPMDIGGKKMAGFASGVIDSFQYYGSAISLAICGFLMSPYKDPEGKNTPEAWLRWFIVMGIFSLVGALSMFLLNRKHKRLGH